MEQATIPIQSEHGMTPVPATVSGNLAIHLNGLDGIHGSGYTLTHVPTGRAVLCGLTKKLAGELLNVLAPLPVWNFELEPKSEARPKLIAIVQVIAGELVSRKIGFEYRPHEGRIVVGGWGL